MKIWRVGVAFRCWTLETIRGINFSNRARLKCIKAADSCTQLDTAVVVLPFEYLMLGQTENYTGQPDRFSISLYSTNFNWDSVIRRASQKLILHLRKQIKGGERVCEEYCVQVPWANSFVYRDDRLRASLHAGLTFFKVHSLPADYQKTSRALLIGVWERRDNSSKSVATQFAWRIYECVCVTRQTNK